MDQHLIFVMHFSTIIANSIPLDKKMFSISLTRLNITHYVSQLEQYKNNALLPPINRIQIKLDINEACNSPLMDITTISSNQILSFSVPYRQHHHISKTKNAITLANLSIIKKFLHAIPDETKDARNKFGMAKLSNEVYYYSVH